jgi:hypothetical protein
MGKALVINGADFSALKIDKVSIPRELNTTTLAWITASGNDSLTEAQKTALDDLVLALKANNNSLMSKIKRLWLPMIAGSKATSLYEYKNGVNSASSFDATQLTRFDNVGFVGGQGIYPIAGSIQALVVDATFEGNTKNISFFSLNALAYDPTLSNTALGIGCPSNVGGGQFAFDVYIQSVGQSRIPRFIYPNIGTDTINRYLDNQGNRFAPLLRGVVSNSEGVKFFASGAKFVQSSVATDVHSVTESQFTGLSILRGVASYFYTNGDTPIAMYIVADGTITEDEANTLKGASEALLTAMNPQTNVEN